MLGHSRTFKNTKHTKRLVLPAESHTLVYNCAKFEKFFHYYSVCGILVQSAGIIELRRRKHLEIKENQQSPFQLVYKHSKQPVLLQLCDESSYVVGGEQECDIDMLVDDNGLRVAATETAKNAAYAGESMDAARLHDKRKEKVEQHDTIDNTNLNDVHTMQHLQDSVLRDEFGDSVDNDRPRQFLSNNLVDLVLLNTALSEFIVVYLQPVPELRRTRIQFYWCVRETRVPYSPLIANWMLQNYTDRYGQQQENTQTTLLTSQPTLPDLYRFADYLDANVAPNATESANNAPQQHASNQHITNSWQQLSTEETSAAATATDGVANINLAAVAQWLNDVAAITSATRPKQSDFATVDQHSRSVVTIEAICVNETRSDQTVLSNHTIATSEIERSVKEVFLDDALVIADDYRVHCERYNLQCSNSDVFRTESLHPHWSNNEIYMFTFFVEDLRRFCATEKLFKPPHIGTDNAQKQLHKIRPPKNMLFRCAFDNTDVEIFDKEIQLALKKSGFVVTPSENADDHGTNFEYNFARPQIDAKYHVALDTQCRLPEFQLSLITLLNQVAKLEIERIEPYEIEPPNFASVSALQSLMMENDQFPLPPSQRNKEMQNEHIVLTHQQTCTFQWLRDREDAVVAMKDRKRLTTISVANTGWSYDCISGEMKWQTPSSNSSLTNKRKNDNAEEKFAKRKKNSGVTIVMARKPDDKDQNAIDEENESLTTSDNVADEFNVEAFIRNHKGAKDLTFFGSVASARRQYQTVSDAYNVLFLSGGLASGKRTTVVAHTLYELSPVWNCVVENEQSLHKLLDDLEEIKARRHDYTTRGTARETRLYEQTLYDLRNKYFDQTLFYRGKLFGDAVLNIDLSRLSILHALHMQWKTYNDDYFCRTPPAVAEEGEIIFDNGAELTRAVLGRIIAKHQHNESITVKEVFNEMWYSFQMLRSHYDVARRANQTPAEKQQSSLALEDQLKKIQNRLKLIDRNEPLSLQHSKLITRTTLIVCPQSEIDHWLQSARRFGDNECCYVESDLPHNWSFVASNRDCGPIDAAVYCIRTVADAQTLTWCNLFLADIVIVSFETLSSIELRDATYLRPFAQSVSNIKKAEFCDSLWMRCVRQYMSIVESTPMINLSKTNDEINKLPTTQKKQYVELEQVPFEAVRWQRVVLANYDAYLQKLALVARKKRSGRADRLTRFLDNVRCVRKLFVSSESHNAQTLCNYFLPVLRSNLVTTSVAEPMIPTSLESYRRRWRHDYGDPFLRHSISHVHPQFLLCYARQCTSMCIIPRYKIRQWLLGGVRDHCRTKSNRFVLRDIVETVALTSEQTDAIKHISALLNAVQQTQALHRAESASIYTSNASSALFFTTVGQNNTMDMFKGGLGSRSPADMLLNVSVLSENCNSAVDTAQCTTIPTHIFVFQSHKGHGADLVRLVRLLDRYDPAAWREFYFSRQTLHAVDIAASADALKPTYRYILNTVTHMPHLIPIIGNQLAELLLFRQSRLLSTMIRSSSDAPEVPLTFGNSSDILHRSLTQAAVVESFLTLPTNTSMAPPPPIVNMQQIPPPPPPIVNMQQIPPPPPIVNAQPEQSEELQLIDMWYEQMRPTDNATAAADAAAATPTVLPMPNLTCFERTKTWHSRPANFQDQMYAHENSTFSSFLSWRLSTILAEELRVQHTLQTHTRPDIATGISTCTDMGYVRVPVNRVEMLNSHAANLTGYRHAIVSMVDRCMMALCDTVMSPHSKTMQKISAYAASNKIDTTSSNWPTVADSASLTDTLAYRNSASRLVCAEEQPNSLNAPVQTQRILRRSIVHDEKKLHREFFSIFSAQYLQYVKSLNGTDEEVFDHDGSLYHHDLIRSTSFSDDEAEYDELETTIFDDDTDANFPATPPPNNVTAAQNIADDTFHANLMRTNLVIPAEILAMLTQGTETIPQPIQFVPQQNTEPTTATTAAATATTSSTNATANTAPILDAVQKQTIQATCVLNRYIITEQNLLFEKRCTDWMIIQLIRDLDRFVASFNTHQFMKRVPLLCRLAEQCGGETGKTEQQRIFSERHKFYSANLLLHSSNSTEIEYIKLPGAQLRELALQHLEHHARTLLPLIEMLTYSGHIQGAMRSVASAELQKLLDDTNASERERQEMLVKIIGGVKTSAPTYINNMISKFCYETRWIVQDLAFIRQQRQRTIDTLPALSKLRDSIATYQSDNKLNDAFECPLCMESLVESDSVALYPCGHMCCYTCHIGCNKAMVRPRDNDNAYVGISTPGLQCFHCRYLLQFHEQVVKATFKDAIQRLIATTSTTASTTSATKIASAAMERVSQRVASPCELYDPSNVEVDSPPLNLCNAQHYFDYDTASDEETGEEVENDDDAKKDSDSEETEFLKIEKVCKSILSRLHVFAALYDYNYVPKKIVLLSNMTHCLQKIKSRLSLLIRGDSVLQDKLLVDFDYLPQQLDDEAARNELLEERAYHESKIPVCIYSYNMDLHFSLHRGAAISSLRYMSDVDSIFFVEIPMIRLVDDRASHMLAMDVEQRILARFCNEFSANRGSIQVYRFVLDSEEVKTVDRVWYEDTRWYL